GGSERVLDVYAGTGTFTLPLAKRAAEAIGIESSAIAVRDAERNAARNGIQNASFWTGEALEVMGARLPSERSGFDAVLVDPPRYGKGEIARFLQRNGASFNAGTSLDYTNYYEVLAADRLELAMEIEADRMENALIPEEEHHLEMTVVRSELERNEDNPHRALYQEMFALAFEAHPYHWPTIGWRSDVEAIRTEQIRSYYKTHYMP